MTELQIRCFLEVCRHLNFSNAAKALFISQSNISRQIARLEEELCLELFLRNTKSVKLTEQGEILSEVLFKVVPEWQNALVRAKNSVKKYSGSLTIGCTPHTKSNSYLSQLLSSFRAANPEIRIIKERNTQRQLIDGLNNNYYDAVLLAAHDADFLSGVVTETMFYSRIGIAIYKSHPLFFENAVTLADFRDSGFLRYSPTNIPLEQDFMHTLCEAGGFTPRIVSEFDDFEEFLFSIEMGEGVALVLEETEVISNMNLRFIPINEDYPQKYQPMQLAKKESNNSPTVDAFYQYARRYALMQRNKSGGLSVG